MKKILVISYFFPPCNLTAAQRPASWANYFVRSGLYPHVVTRKWEHPLKQYADEGYPTSLGEETEVSGTNTVHRLPYSSSWRDKLWVKYGDSRFTILRRLLTVLRLLAQNLSIRFSAYRFLYDKADALLSGERFDAIVVCGNPFNQFQIGYRLHKKYGIPWVADYRDAWTTSEINRNERSRLFRFFDRYDSFFEKRWVGTASFVTSVSEPLAAEIGTLVNRPHSVIENGYETGMFDPVAGLPKKDVFTVTYIGTLYHGQRIEFFLSAFEAWVKANALLPNQCQISFMGLAISEEQAERVRSFSAFLLPYLYISGRVPQPEVLAAEVQSHALLYVGWKGYKGIIPSKIYEYCASGTPVLVAPADNGEVDRIVHASGGGFSAQTAEEIGSFLQQQFLLFNTGQTANASGSFPIETFSRTFQAKRLAERIHQILT